ncbi:MAG: nucleoside diphosphate kinase regulator [Syntrophales bacterium]|nr:nucleoside diphosphate kinase regulator [Syntrophales bacterium]MDD5232551.1 nucleoside diphosphate kinase regulator [Syntrophales bacterium]
MEERAAAMKERTIFITRFDMERLRNLIDGIRDSRGKIRSDLNELEKELDRANLIDPEHVPADVITMNSRVHLKDLDSGEDLILTLVFPSGADIKENRISILAPIGTALLGYREGDAIEWKVPSGLRRMRVVKIIYQPEASGDYHL